MIKKEDSVTLCAVDTLQKKLGSVKVLFTGLW